MASPPAIQTAQLGKQYGGRVRALAEVDLTVPPGTVFGLLGQNGAGKTTLIRILLDMIRPTKGRASILGFDCQDDGVEARAHVGYLPSSAQYYSYMTGRDLFDFAARARRITPRNAALVVRRYVVGWYGRRSCEATRKTATAEANDPMNMSSVRS